MGKESWQIPSYYRVEMGQRCKEIRRGFLGMSQEEFGHAFDLSISHISSVENGKSNYSISVLARMKIDYTVDIGYILTGIKASSDVQSLTNKQLLLENKLDEIDVLLKKFTYS